MPLFKAKEATPKVLVPKKLSSDGLALLQNSLDVGERKGLIPDQLLEIVPNYDALLVRSETKVTATVLRAAQLTFRLAAEHTIALMISMARKIPETCASLENGSWERGKFVGVEVKRKILGIVGLGKVGLTVARLAKGLGMVVSALDPYASPAVAASASVNLVSSLPELLSSADSLAIHTPLIASTHGMISEAGLAQMKPGARILNVARKRNSG